MASNAQEPQELTLPGLVDTTCICIHSLVVLWFIFIREGSIRIWADSKKKEEEFKAYARNVAKVWIDSWKEAIKVLTDGLDAVLNYALLTVHSFTSETRKLAPKFRYGLNIIMMIWFLCSAIQVLNEEKPMPLPPRLAQPGDPISFFFDQAALSVKQRWRYTYDGEVVRMTDWSID